MLPLFLGAGLVLALLLLCAILRRLSYLPAALRAHARKEREEAEARALGAMQEAVAGRVGTAVTAIRQYQEQIAAGLRVQVAGAEARARASERRAADVSTALEAASTLVRELRGVLDRAVGTGGAVERSGGKPPDGDGERETIDMGGRATPLLPAAQAGGDGDEPEEEPTQVATRPRGGTNGARACVPPSAQRSGAREASP